MPGRNGGGSSKWYGGGTGEARELMNRERRRVIIPVCILSFLVYLPLPPPPPLPLLPQQNLPPINRPSRHRRIHNPPLLQLPHQIENKPITPFRSQYIYRDG